jgi:GGDEF domain-containing protein
LLGVVATWNQWPVTFSFGLVAFDTPPQCVEEMVKQVDAIMYSVKPKAKNSMAAPGPG